MRVPWRSELSVAGSIGGTTPALADDARYAWERWAILNGVQSWRDLTTEYGPAMEAYLEESFQ